MFLFQFLVKASVNGSDEINGKIVRKEEKDSLQIDFSGEKPPTPFLDTINYPKHMKNLSKMVNSLSNN